MAIYWIYSLAIAIERNVQIKFIHIKHLCLRMHQSLPIGSAEKHTPNSGLAIWIQTICEEDGARGGHKCILHYKVYSVQCINFDLCKWTNKPDYSILASPLLEREKQTLFSTYKIPKIQVVIRKYS